MIRQIGRRGPRRRGARLARRDEPPYVAQLIYLVVLIALVAVSALLQPSPDIENARPPGLGDFDFPTATEGRAIPVVFGSVILKAPNVIWYGDLALDPIEIDSGGLFSSKKSTVGYKYYVGMHMAICHGPLDELYQIEVDGQVVNTDVFTSSGTGSINEPDLLGEENGMIGGFEYYEGVNAPAVIGLLDPEISQYIADQIGGGVKADTPAYANISQVVWLGPASTDPPSFTDGYIGNSENIKPWSFYVRRFPNTIGLGGGMERVGDDANPVAVIYELLTDSVWGLGLDAGRINTAAMLSVGATLFAEGNGFGLIWSSARKARELLNEVIRQIDAVLYEDDAGLLTVRLVRAPTAPELAAAPTLDETNTIEIQEFDRGAWSQTVNHVQISFDDRDDDFKKTSAVQMDLANFLLQGEDVPSRNEYPGVKTGALAQAIGERELAQQSYPLARITMRANRTASGLRPGSIFFFSSEFYGIVSTVMRVLTVDLTDLGNDVVGLTAVQDVFGLASTAFAAPPLTGHTPPPSDPTAIIDLVVSESPRWYANIDGSLPQVEKDQRTLNVAGRPSGVSTDYRVLIAQDLIGNPYEELGSADSFCPYSTIVGGLPLPATLAKDAVGFLISGPAGVDLGNVPASISANDELNGRGLLLIEDGVTFEFASFDTFAPEAGNFRVSGIRRGMLDEAPVVHAASARCWFIGIQGIAGSLTNFTDGQAIFTKLQPTVGGTRLDEGSIVAVPTTFMSPSRSLRPIVVANPRVGNPGGEVYNPGAVSASMNVRTIFSRRDRLSPVLEFPDSADVNPADATYFGRVIALDQVSAPLPGSPYDAAPGATQVDIPSGDLAGVTTLQLTILSVTATGTSVSSHSFPAITVNP